MAHRQLADEYRAKLTEAQDRIYVLEGTIADRDHEIEHLKTSSENTTTGEPTGAYGLRIAELEQSLRESQKRFKDALDGVLTEDEGLGVDNHPGVPGPSYLDEYIKAKREAKTLREQNEALQNRVADLENHTSDSQSVPSGAVSAGSLAKIYADMEDLKNQLETYRTAEVALRQQLGKAGGKDQADAVYIDALKSQIKDLTAAQSSMQITTANITEKMNKAVKKQQRAQEILDDRNRYVERLKMQLVREKEARMAAQSKGGCSSKVCKSCKTCNPIIVDIDMDDEEPIKSEDFKTPTTHKPNASKTTPGIFDTLATLQSQFQGHQDMGGKEDEQSKVDHHRPWE